MKYKRWYCLDHAYTHKVNYIDDVFDLKRFKKRSFTDFKELLNMPKEREAKQKAKNVLTSFLKTLAQDIIVKNEIFVLPCVNFGYIKITNTADPRRKDYFYDIESEGKIFTPKLTLDNRVVKMNKKHYKLRFNQNLRIQMMNLIKSGHKYM
jgi:hypothetical protein